MADDKNKKYFPHDADANEDEKIMEMMVYFRHNHELLSPSVLPFASLGLYWTIVQYLHKGKQITQDKIEIFADEWRIDANFLKKILTGFKLFKLNENGTFYSKRVLENIEIIKEKSRIGKENASRRWNNQAKKTDEEKENLKEAKKKLSESKNIEISLLLSQYDDFRTLDEIKQLSAIDFYKQNKKSITKTLAFIKKELKDNG